MQISFFLRLKSVRNELKLSLHSPMVSLKKKSESLIKYYIKVTCALKWARKLPRKTETYESAKCVPCNTRKCTHNGFVSDLLKWALKCRFYATGSRYRNFSCGSRLRKIRLYRFLIFCLFLPYLYRFYLKLNFDKLQFKVTSQWWKFDSDRTGVKSLLW